MVDCINTSLQYDVFKKVLYTGYSSVVELHIIDGSNSNYYTVIKMFLLYNLVTVLSTVTLDN